VLHFRLVVPGDDGVLNQRVAGRDETHTNGPGVHPGAGLDLEIFSDTTVEGQTLRGIPSIDEPHGVADLVKTLIVESLAREIGAAVVARRDVGSLHPHFELVG